MRTCHKMVPFKGKKHFGYMLKYISCKKKILLLT